MNLKSLVKKLTNRKNSVDIPAETGRSDSISKANSSLPADGTARNEASECMPEERLEQVKERCRDFDRDYVWVFSAGNDGQAFRGNPKYLFVYINRYRPDIYAYWMCKSEDTIGQIRSLGFDAWHSDSVEAQYLLGRTGVIAAEQVKAVLPEAAFDAKYLNLWHGVGFKRIERSLFLGDIAKGIAKKYIEHGTYYRNHQLLCVTSPAIEKEFMEDLGVDEDQLVRTGYLRCQYQQNFQPVATYDHDLKKRKGLKDSVRLAVYAPTYRPRLGDTFARAIPDLEALHGCCKEKDLLMIFKVHPNMEEEAGFLHAKETYGDYSHFFFWDNRDDFYEIMDQMDLAIIDYSSILSDMAAVGIRHYIRYIFDQDEYMQDGFTIDDYENRTTGQICRSFSELLTAINTYEDKDYTKDLDRIQQMFWEYSSGKEDFDKTIQSVMDYKVKRRTFPRLYSFDIFDTLISRKVLDPVGIFHIVREKMAEAGGFPKALVLNYPAVRHSAEFNVREYFRKSTEERGSDRVEIGFDMIFERLKDIYQLTDEQVEDLRQWELAAELDNVIPLKEQISLLKEYLKRGEDLVLISDMYLPKDFIRRMLKKADPVLAELPLFLSSEYGVQKTSQDLFFEVYKSFRPFYDYEKWIHYGDNLKGDQSQPRKLGICTRKIQRVMFGNFQQELSERLATADGYLVAALQARMFSENNFKRDHFVISFVSLCMVPYVDWVLRDSIRRGYETLYFVSRDGYHLKRIADAIIEVRKLPLKTKYIYASRKTWRIPSFIHEVDEGIFRPYGNFTGLNSRESLLDALDMEEDDFRTVFPTVHLEGIDWDDKKKVADLISLFRLSGTYREYLLDKAASCRPLVSGYLKQEIDPSESFAFVEYWGRGYTQDCMVRLWQEITGEESPVAYYYSRSVDPSAGSSIRYNFTTNDSSQLFVENIFANMPYKSIEGYQEKEGKILPIIVPGEYDKELFASMESLLPEFAARYAALDLKMPEDTDRMLYDFVLSYQTDHETDPEFIRDMGSIEDTPAMYARRREFAPAFSMKDLDQFADKLKGRSDKAVTSSTVMSVLKSDEEVRKRYCQLYQIFPGEDLKGGKLLTPSQLKTNQTFEKKYYDLYGKAEAFRQEYESVAYSMETGDLITLIYTGKSLHGAGMDKVEEALRGQEKFRIECISEKGLEADMHEAARLLGESSFIIIPKPIPILSRTHIKDSSKLILLAERAFPLFNQGFAVDYALRWKVNYKQLEGCNDVDILQVPSEDRKEFYIKNFSRNRAAGCTIPGCCATDLYFDQDYVESARRKLTEEFPEAGDRKVILYLASAKTPNNCPEWSNMLDMETLSRTLPEDYVVAINLPSGKKPSSFSNKMEISGFSKVIGSSMTIRQLVCAADVIIGDYRDTFFEAALVHKPMYSTAYDYESKMKDRNLSLNANDFDKFIFCPLVRSANELAEHLGRIEDYNYGPMEEFVRVNMRDCDGRSTERLVEYLIN